jgi:hypothetical protein
MTNEELLRRIASLRFTIQFNRRLQLEFRACLSKLLREYSVSVDDDLLACVVVAVPEELPGQHIPLSGNAVVDQILSGSAPRTPPQPGAPGTGTPPQPGAPATPPQPGVPRTGTPPQLGAPSTPPQPGVPRTGTPPQPGVPRTGTPPQPGVPRTGTPPQPGTPPQLGVPPTGPHRRRGGRRK